ncbi:MAG: CPBP family intramembrane metalloprotease [Chlamydiae bacterium]|jgi:membrane protease YdiL (CAAX protease family)|nr:CPBP family intramembrane metalloprotease [Chlamydiota bacterium]
MKALQVGLFSWFLAFPWITLLSQATNYILHELLHLPSHEQLAVRYVKLALAFPLTTLEALSVVILLAPLIEEFLFRGLLQNFLLQHLSRGKAIVLSSIAFTLLHIAPEQAWDNVTLALSLFPLGCLLGFLYEKYQTLFAPLVLHALFNGISALQLFYLTR